ncbi:hypothetical protein MMC08_001902 [Hypocenomyce scalaris]|nr:hypothetical protein [Hypocenomyce scalaris]
MSSRNGQLREYLSAGISGEDFKRRLGAVLDPVTPALNQTVETPYASSANTESIAPETEVAAPSTSTITSAQPTTPSVTQSPATAPTSTVQSLLEDRRRRLEADKKAKDAAEKAERIAKANARRAEAEAAAAAGANPDSAKAKQLSYAQQQRKRQQAARLERERIVREIENDKAMRREKEERRKALAKAEAEGNDGANGLVDRQLSSEASTPRPTSSKICAVQVRLFDGSTIRSRFTSESTLRSDVRKWVDENRSDGDIPYTFKQILAPLPSRALTITEEEETLQSLGLTPSATLVMIPVQGFTAAYNSGPSIVSRGLSAGYDVVSGGVGIVSGGVGMVTGALGTFLGVGQARPPTTEPATGRPTAQGATDTPVREPATTIRTLRDQENRDKRQQQFYNGNTLNFEPREDQDDARD